MDLKQFKLERILANNTANKVVYLLGTFNGDQSGDKAIVKFEKTEFVAAELQNLGKNEDESPLVKADEYFHNDIFRKFWVLLKEDILHLQCDVIYPATQTLINKY